MATDIVIKQEGIFKKNFNFKAIQSVLSKSLAFGFLNESYVLKDLEDEQYSGSVCVYDKKKIGRGFQILVKDKDVFMSLPLPCMMQDVHIFYDSLTRVMEAYKIKRFDQNEDFFSFNEIESVRFKQLSFLDDYVTHEVMNIGTGIETHPAALYQITINYNDLYDGISKKYRVSVFDSYLESLQAQDVFFPSQLLYNRKDSGTIFGIYALTEDVVTILPKEPNTFLSLGRNDDDVVGLVAIGQFIDDQYTVVGEVLYSVFKEIIHFDLQEEFFHNHVKYNLNKDDIELLRPYLLSEDDKGKL